MTRLSLAAIAAVSWLCGFAGSVDARHSPTDAVALVSASRTAHGIRLTLTLGRNVYPRAALVRATIRVENVSNHVVNLWGPSAGGNGVYYPEVDVLGRHGRTVFPPALHYGPVGPGQPRPFPNPLTPGQSFVRHGFIVLRGNRVRAQVPIDLNNTLPGFTLRTPAIQVTLTKPDRPRTHIQGFPEGVRLEPRGPVTGRLHYMLWTQCYYAPPADVTENGLGLWTTTSTSVTTVVRAGRGEVITPACPALEAGGRVGNALQWHLIAGWPNHSTVIVDFPHG